MRSTCRPAPRQILQEDIIKRHSGYPIALLLTICLIGCGSNSNHETSSSDSASAAGDKAKDEGERKKFVTGLVKLQSQNDEGTSSWTVDGESARAGIQESGENEFFLQSVTGEIKNGTAVSSTFTADGAKAVTETKKLVLTGNVKLTSVADKLNLKADKITWMADKELFAASGNVQIDSPTWQLGKMKEVWATPDLKKIGAPSKFK